MTTVVVCGMDDLEQEYRMLVERIRGYPMSESGRAAILAEVERQYRRESAARQEVDQRNSTSSL